MARLSVNVDHVATLRQARGVDYPDPVQAAVLADLAGVNGITVHLRQDKRHIQERDVYLIRHIIKSHLTLEMAATEEMFEIAKGIVPDMVTLVPENAGEITTEGGLNLDENPDYLEEFINRLQKEVGCVACLFIDPDEETVKNAARLKADFIELHTGKYAEAHDIEEELKEFRRLERMAHLGFKLKLGVNAGHGLNYRNVINIANIKPIEEFSIGHSIIARSVFVGIERAVKEMMEIVRSHE
ncbi:pyridoxine 5'-phosphate synthase [bacterium]|nr:pyridoxine 5'-phosphate synthase [bacterium]